MKTKKQKREASLKDSINEITGVPKPEDQLRLLDVRLGNGVGAKKERARLAKVIGEKLLVCGHHQRTHPQISGFDCLAEEAEQFSEEQSRWMGEGGNYLENLFEEESRNTKEVPDDCDDSTNESDDY